MFMDKETFALIVKAQNEANRIARELYVTLSVFFQQFLGKKIVKSNCYLRKIATPKFSYSPDVTINTYVTPTWLTFEVFVTIRINGNINCNYTPIVLGKLNAEGTLLEIKPDPKFPQYDVEEFWKGIKQYEEMKAELEEKKDSLYPFNRYLS